jgi:hypothetical protein
VGDDLEQIVVLARDAVALEDLREGADLGLDLADAPEVVAADADADVRRDGVADLLGRDIGAVAADDATLLERADAAKALRRRQVDPGREVDVRDPAVGLDGFQNLAVDRVEAGGHGVETAADERILRQRDHRRNNRKAHFAASRAHLLV